MLVGVVISVLQVVTQVQEMSLTFVPKLFTAGAVLVVAGPWMLRKLTQFTTNLWNSIPAISMNAASSLPDAMVSGLGSGWLISTGLLSLRVAATFLMTPVFYAVPLPTTVRALLLLSLAVALAAGLPASNASWNGWSALLASALAEVALGATLGLGILLAFG
eukprot:gene16488-21061_t